MSRDTMYQERYRQFRMDPEERDIAWEQFQALALPDRLRDAMLAREWSEVGRIVTGFFEGFLWESAVESVDNEQDGAEAMDWAMSAGMAVCCVTGDPS